MKLNNLKQSKGFTLVEILIVVIIVGLLAGIAVSKLGDSKERAVISVKKSAAAELNKAIQTAYVKGDVITTVPAAGSDQASTTPGSGAGTTALNNVLALTEISSQFTASSLDELGRGVIDDTPNTGGFAVTGATHKELEIIYAENVADLPTP